MASLDVTSSHPFGAVPLTPTAFLDRAARVFAAREAVIDPEFSITYESLWDRCLRLSGALHALGVQLGDRVSVLVPNSHVALEVHFGVPYCGAVLNMLNTRLSGGELAYIVGHAGSKVLIADEEYLDLAYEALTPNPDVRLVVAGDRGDYEELLATARQRHHEVEDENALLSINYTSGTTGSPKGVMYSHRGAYLQALAMAAHADLDVNTRFLWTLPMFHCNGWCFPWAVTACGAAHVPLRRVEATEIWGLIDRLGVTHFNAAPTVLTMLAESASAAASSHPIHVATGGAPPSPALISALENLGIEVTHLYGLTETYGPAVICEWQAEWDAENPSARARLRARQGIANMVSCPLRVVDVEGNDVLADGATLGEVVMRGNNVMLGYHRDPEATDSANLGGWFRTGDLGVLHPNGYLELRDRSKDIIISGGENISSIEVEQVISGHPSVLECAVVSEPHTKWGEVPVAFVTLRQGAVLDAEELRQWVRARIAHFKVPRSVHFGELPKTATGKIQKYVLRQSLVGVGRDTERSAKRANSTNGA